MAVQAAVGSRGELQGQVLGQVQVPELQGQVLGQVQVPELQGQVLGQVPELPG